MTATITGDVHVITHAIEATYHRDDEGKLEMHISDNLATKIDSYLEPGLRRCGWGNRKLIRDSGRIYHHRRGSGGGIPVYTPSTPFDLPACLTDLKGPIQQAIRHLPDDLLGLIQGVKGIVLEPLHIGGSVTKYVEDLYKHALAEDALKWVPMIAIMMAIDVLVALMAWYATDHSTRVATHYKIAENVWLENDKEPAKCKDLKEKPVCNHDDCKGRRPENALTVNLLY